MDELIPSKDKREFFMRAVYLAADLSKDPRTRIGGILVKNDTIISTGFNGFARKVRDLKERWNDKEQKYSYVVHGEENTILNAARLGVSTMGATLYTPGQPCSSCTKTLINAGVVKVVTHCQWPNLIHSDKWVESIKLSHIMMKEAGIELEWFDKELGIKGYLDGKEILV